MKKSKKNPKISSLSLNSIQELTDIESEQVRGGVGVIQYYKINPGEVRGIGTSPLFANPFA